MIQEPKVTVLTTVWNGAEFIRETIESILKQTFQDFEFIIVDDNSTDDTVAIVQSFKDERIKLIQNEHNLGTYKSANVGLEDARGKYIARMDADDISLPNRLEKQYTFMEANPEYALIGAWGLVIDEIGNILGEKKRPVSYANVLSDMFFGTPVIHSAAFFNREFVKGIGNYNDNERKSQDFELYLKVIRNGGKICNLPEYLIFYRTHASSITSTQYTEQEEIAHQIITKYLHEIFGWDVAIEDIRRMRMASGGRARELSRQEKLQVIKYYRQLRSHLLSHYGASADLKTSIRDNLTYLVHEVFQNRLFRKAAKFYIFTLP